MKATGWLLRYNLALMFFIFKLKTPCFNCENTHSCMWGSLSHLNRRLTDDLWSEDPFGAIFTSFLSCFASMVSSLLWLHSRFFLFGSCSMHGLWVSERVWVHLLSPARIHALTGEMIEIKGIDQSSSDSVTLGLSMTPWNHPWLGGSHVLRRWWSWMWWTGGKGMKMLRRYGNTEVLPLECMMEWGSCPWWGNKMFKLL